MKITIYFVGFLLPLLCTMQSLNCPYQGEEALIAELLFKCLESSAQLISIKSLLQCIANFTEGTSSTCTSKIAQELTQHAFINKKDYSQCSTNFNNLLRVIFEYHLSSPLVSGNTRPENVSSKVWKLVNDSLAYHDYYCSHIDNQYDEQINSLLKKVTVNVTELKFDMDVYKNNDIVSWDIVNKGSWEIDEIKQIFYGLEKYRSDRGITNPADVMFLDIGGQIGWHTMIVGLKGYKVFTFEPMMINQYIIRHNICRNRSMDITYINKGLDKESKICHLYSEDFNKGNAELFCHDYEKPLNRIYQGAIELMKLDEFVYYFKNLAVIKIDIEGSEYNVMKGGRSVMLNMHVPYILTEWSPYMIRQKNGDPIAYIQEFMNAGYKVDTKGFEGANIVDINFIREKADQDKQNYKGVNINLYLIYTGS